MRIVAIIIQPPRELDAVPSLFRRTSVASSDNRRMSVDSIVAPPRRRVGTRSTTSRRAREEGPRWPATRLFPLLAGVKRVDGDGILAADVVLFRSGRRRQCG